MVHVFGPCINALCSKGRVLKTAYALHGATGLGVQEDVSVFLMKLSTVPADIIDVVPASELCHSIQVGQGNRFGVGQGRVFHILREGIDDMRTSLG